MATQAPDAPTTPDSDSARIVERPDGFYWQDARNDKMYGPFATLLEAEQDMESQSDTEGYEEGETLEDAEAEIGISDWIDPETGEPAEGVLPRFSDN